MSKVVGFQTKYSNQMEKGEEATYLWVYGSYIWSIELTVFLSFFSKI